MNIQVEIGVYTFHFTGSSKDMVLTATTGRNATGHEKQAAYKKAYGVFKQMEELENNQQDVVTRLANIKVCAQLNVCIRGESMCLDSTCKANK